MQNYAIKHWFTRQIPAGLGTVTLSLILTGCSGGSESTATMPATATTPPEASISTLEAARTALGMEGLATLTYSGTAWRIRNSFRQTLTASPPWPAHDEISNYQYTIDLTTPTLRATGETFASNLFLEPPVAGVYTQNVAPGETAWGQQLEYWLTPWGFLQGAETYGAEEAVQTINGMPMTTLSWHSPDTQTSPSGLQYTVTGYLDDANLVRRVETWVEDAFMGDMHVLNTYDNYATVDSVLLPTTIEQQRGGGGIFGVSVTAASRNPANAQELLAIPAPPARPGGAGGAPAAPAELSRQVADGVYWITTGYTSLAVEFADHIAVVEAGGSEAIGEQILAEAKRLFPTKPVRYLVNSHPHSDHTPGMLPFIREGVTIVTHPNNVDFLRMALSTPRTLLGQATLDPQFMDTTDVTVLEDATRRLELHHIANLHTDGMYVAYLPNERILFEADFTLPVAGANPNPFVINLAEYVDQAGLQFDQYLAVHAAQTEQTMADLMATIGK